MKGVVPVVRNRIPASFKPRTVFVPQTLDNWGEIEGAGCVCCAVGSKGLTLRFQKIGLSSLSDNPCHRSIIVQSIVESNGAGSVADKREEALGWCGFVEDDEGEDDDLGVLENPQNWESEEQSVLEAEERLEDVKSEVEKMADIVTEQWIQFRHLELALMGVLVVAIKTVDTERQLCLQKCSLFEVNMLLSAVKKYHLQLQDFVRQEMEKIQLTAFYTSEELVLFSAGHCSLSFCITRILEKHDSFTTDYAYTATDYVYIATDYEFIATNYADIATDYAYIATDYAFIATYYVYIATDYAYIATDYALLPSSELDVVSPNVDKTIPEDKDNLVQCVQQNTKDDDPLLNIKDNGPHMVLAVQHSNAEIAFPIDAHDKVFNFADLQPSPKHVPLTLAESSEAPNSKSPLNVRAAPFLPGFSVPEINTMSNTVAEESGWIPARKLKQLKKMEKQKTSPQGPKTTRTAALATPKHKVDALNVEPTPLVTAEANTKPLNALSSSISIRGSDNILEEGENMERIIEDYNNLFPDLILTKEDKIGIKSSCNRLAPITQNALPPLTMYSRGRDLDNDVYREDYSQYCRRTNPYID
ncbi:unnamed protein product [Rhodiola kirilowii]